MPLYEHVFLARQDLSQAQVDALAASATEIVEQGGGKVAKTETWGLKSLAYKIDRNRKAHFVLLEHRVPRRRCRRARAAEPHQRGRDPLADHFRSTSMRKAPSAQMRKNERDRKRRAERRGAFLMARPFFRRRKSCPFSAKDAPLIDYKDVRLLQGLPCPSAARSCRAASPPCPPRSSASWPRRSSAPPPGPAALHREVRSGPPMQIILLERIEKLGTIGDVVTVKDGYARNFLLPNKKALRRQRRQPQGVRGQPRAARGRERGARATDAEKAGSKVDGTELVLIRSSSNSGQLYGSVNVRDIADALREKGHDVNKSQIISRAPRSSRSACSR